MESLTSETNKINIIFVGRFEIAFTSCGRTLSMWSSVTTFLFWSEACLAALTELSTTKTFVSSVISSTASSEIFVLVLVK
jgi:hypothetical protein